MIPELLDHFRSEARGETAELLENSLRGDVQGGHGGHVGPGLHLNDVLALD